jgi:dynein heavy chain
VSAAHYDFGMRAMMMLVKVASSLKYAHPDFDENMLVVKAFLSKYALNPTDTLQLHQIVSCLFPDIIQQLDVSEASGDLQQAILDQIFLKKLQPHPDFVAKVLQLHETCNIRHGVALLGPTCGGKTQLRSVLSGALSALQDSHNVHQHELNPKVVDFQRLYGAFDPVPPHEWIVGVLEQVYKAIMLDIDSGDIHWLVMDGPIVSFSHCLLSGC